MYEEQIDGLAELILELRPSSDYQAKQIKQWINGTVNDIVLAERQRAKEIVMSCIARKIL
jgi:hypothetical protein